MRKILLTSLLIITALVFGAVRLYRDPRVRDLFEPIRPGPVQDRGPTKPKESSGGTVQKDAKPRSATQDLPEGNLQPQPQPQERRGQPEEPAVSPSGRSQIPNSTVSRVLMQILAAKQLAEGVSVGVTDDSVLVAGTVDSEEKRNRILSVIEKGRENRKIDATHLKVVNDKPGSHRPPPTP